jgi:hypothetical protein
MRPPPKSQNLFVHNELFGKPILDKGISVPLWLSGLHEAYWKVGFTCPPQNFQSSNLSNSEYEIGNSKEFEQSEEIEFHL